MMHKTVHRKHMMHKTVHRLILLILFACITKLTSAQEPNFYTFSVNDGLPSNNILSLTVSKKGQLFVGTGSGAAIFNGKTFSPYQASGKEDGNLKGGQVESLISIANGDIWFGSGNGGISILRSDKKFQYLNSFLSNNRIRGLFEDSKGNIWIGTDQGLNKYHPKSERFQIFDTSNGLSHNWVRQITEDSNGFIWVGTWGGGVSRIDPQSEVIKTYRYSESDPDTLGDDIVYSMFTDSRGGVWAGTFGTTLNKYSMKCDCFQRAPNNFEPVKNNNVNYVWDITELADGQMVAATGTGLYYITPKGTEKKFNFIPPLDKSISKRTITSIAQTPDGTLWLGTLATGLISIPPQGFSFLNITQREEGKIGVTGKGILSISKVDSQIAISSSTGISLYKQQGRSLLYNKSLLKGIEGHTISRGPEGNLWVASGRQGLHLIVGKKTSEISRKLFGRDDEGIFDITQDDKSIWIPSWHSGVLQYTPSTGKKAFYKVNATIQPRMNSILVAGDDVWVGALNGLYKVDKTKNELKKYLIEPNDSHNQLNAIYDIHDLGNYLWLATETGIFKFNKTTKAFNKVSPAKINKISQSITSDPRGYIWSTLGSDIIKIDSINGSLTNFSESYIPDKVAFMGNSILSLPSGQIYIGGYDGIISFDTNNMYKNDFMHDVFLDSIESDELPLLRNGAYTYQGQVNNLLLTYSTNENRTPRHINYEYRILESQENWTTLKQKGQLFIPYLSHGDYTIEVRVRNGFHAASNPIMLKISILPPFWVSPLALSSYGLLVLFIVYGLHRARISRLNKRKVQLDSIVKARTMELEEKNSTIQAQALKLAGTASQKQKLFETISHELRTPITLILGPVKQLTRQLQDENSIVTANLIERNAIRLNRLVNQMMDLSRAELKSPEYTETTELSVIAKETIETFSPYAIDAEIELSSEIANNIHISLSRDDIDKLLSNLLSNAIKYSRAGDSVSLAVTNHDDKVMITVSDTGIGIPEKHTADIFTRFYRVNPEQNTTIEGSGIGLSIIKNIIDNANGSIEVHSIIGSGTTFIITLPSSVDESSASLMPDGKVSNLASASSSQETYIEHEKPHLLLIDDSQDILTYIKSALSDSYNITTAIDGQEGINKARAIIPDIILSDIMMPKVDGLQLLETLKSDELTNHIPVVMLTAKGSSESKIQGLKLKADDYISKPFDEQELTLRLRNLLDAREILKQKLAAEHFQQTNVVASTRNHSDFLTKLDSIIESNYQNPTFSVSELAREAAVGERQLLRKLKAETTLGPKEYIRTFRLHKSASLLRQGNTASYTANEVGFSSLAYFSSCFKAFYGETPTQFANKKHTA